jgi:hypothetical protein
VNNKTTLKNWATCPNCHTPEWRVAPGIANLRCPNCTAIAVRSRQAPLEVRRMLKATTWEYANPTQDLLEAFRRTGVVATALPDNDPILEEVRVLLELPRDFDGVRFRIRGFLAGRKGLCAGDFKTKSRLKGSLKAEASGSKVEFIRPPPPVDSPSAEGQLIEQELAARTAAVQPLDHLNMAKVRATTSHPLLGVEVNSSSDGSVASGHVLGPLELKSHATLADAGDKGREVLQQLSIQAFAVGVDEGLIIIAERPRLDAVASPRFTAVAVSGLLEFHLGSLQHWISIDEELAALISNLTGGDVDE